MQEIHERHRRDRLGVRVNDELGNGENGGSGANLVDIRRIYKRENIKGIRGVYIIFNCPVHSFL